MHNMQDTLLRKSINIVSLTHISFQKEKKILIKNFFDNFF